MIQNQKRKLEEITIEDDGTAKNSRGNPIKVEHIGSPILIKFSYDYEEIPKINVVLLEKITSRALPGADAYCRDKDEDVNPIFNLMSKPVLAYAVQYYRIIGE